jgi:hypothetical protein
MVRPLSLALLFVAGAFSLQACGGKSRETDAGSSGAGGSGNQAGSGSQAGRAGTGGASACDAFHDDGGWSVVVKIVNETSAALQLGERMASCSDSPLFQVFDADGAPLPDSGSCGSSCEDAMNGSFGPCPQACAIPSAITLQPGESLDAPWRGLFSATKTLPKSCRSSGDSVDCEVAQNVSPGSFKFTAVAGSTLDCSQLGQGMCRRCEPNGGGGCSTIGAIVGGASHSAEITVELDASYGVGAGDGGTDGMTRPIEIVFKD